ncbi:MAG: TnpV protein [Mobilitalea sp.]
MNEVTYSRNGDYLIPDLTLTQQPTQPLGKYGRMRKTYLQEHRKALFNHLLLSEKLQSHLLEIDQTANRRLKQIMADLQKTQVPPDNVRYPKPRCF